MRPLEPDALGLRVTGKEIIKVGDPCSSILFIVNGLIDIEIVDTNLSKHLLDTLKQGDTIG